MNHITKDKLIETTNKIMELYHSGDLPYIMHLCGGNEDQLIEIFDKIEVGDYIFSTHRAHYHYLLAGGTPDELINNIKKGSSMFLFKKELNFYTSSIVAGTPCIAAGVALALKLKNAKQKVWCFIGDGAEDEGHFYEAVRFVQSNDLPCKFIIEDNDKSVDSTRENRHNTYLVNWPACVLRYTYKPVYPHCGSGTKNRISFKKDVIENYKASVK